MSAYILSNALVYLKDILPITAGVGATFRISPDLERGLDINTGGVNAFFILKSSTQIERYLITAVGGVATIVKRGLEQDGVTENANLKKSWGDGSVGYITVKPDDFIALGKLDTAGGLRNTMGTSQNIGATNGSIAITVADTTGWANGATITGTGIPGGTTIVSFVPNTSAVLSANFTGTTGTVSVIVGMRYALEIDNTLNEVKKPISNGAGISPTETIRKRKAGGEYEEVPYSFIQAEMQAGNAAKGIAGEALALRDSLFLETVPTFAISTSQQPISYSALNTRIEIPIFGNGVSYNTFKLALKKTGAPAQNLNVRIETDNAGVASGTLFHANGTSAITAASLSTSFADTTVTLTGNINIPIGTKAWIVLFAGTYGSESLSTTNYYSIGTAGNGDVGSVIKLFRYNGTTHTSTPVSQTGTWTGETSVGVFASSTTNFTAASTMKITSVVKSSNTTTSGTNTCIITQGSKTVSAVYSTHTATFSTPIILTPGAFTIQNTYSGNSNCYESTANTVASDMFFVTSLSVVVRDLRQITATEILPTPYISGSGLTLSVLTKTDSNFGYKLGFVPRICTGSVAQGEEVSFVLGGPLEYPSLTEGGIYFVSTAGAISTTQGTVKMPIGIAASGKLNVGRFDTGITQQLSLGASVTSAPFYHHGGAVTVINTGGTVQMQTSPDNITWTNFFNVTTLSTISLNTPQGYVRGITSAGGACTIYN